MGFILSLIYLATYYFTPATVFGSLAEYRIELILAALVLLVSLPRLSKSCIFRTPQSLALIGMACAVVLSFVVEVHWMGGALEGFLGFIPNAFAFFLVCLHFNTKKRLQVLVAMLVFVCFFVIARGYIVEIRGFPAELARQPGFEGSPYLLAMMNNAGDWFYRLRGLGEIHDPNDFAQLLVCVIPLVFISWRPKRILSNLAFVLLPASILLFGDFLTHSRGSLLALMAIAIVAIRPRIGTLPAAILAGVLFAAAKVLDFAGGRDISVEAGVDRTSLWGQGLDVFKQHPLFGVGLNRLPEYTDVHLTAHSSIVVCAAELGLLGLYFWSLYLFPTVRDALTLASPEKVKEGEAIPSEEEVYPAPVRKLEVPSKSEINRLGRIVTLSLTGYLVAAWFLSRAYVVTLFMIGGIIEVIFEMALRNGMVAPRMKFSRAIMYSGVLAASLVLTMYIMLRVVNATH
jgi:hypothetical protein